MRLAALLVGAISFLPSEQAPGRGRWEVEVVKGEPGPLLSVRANQASALSVLRDIARLHYDLAGFAVPRQLDALLTITTLEHLHYGSDYPFTPEIAAAMAAERLEAAGEPPGSLIEALRTNTERLFPALRATSR